VTLACSLSRDKSDRSTVYAEGWAARLEPRQMIREDGFFDGATPMRGLIQALYEDLDGNLWIGTQGAGVFKYCDGSVERFSSSRGLRDDRVRAFWEDREGSLWIATYAGLSQLRPSRFRSCRALDGLSADRVTSIAQHSDGDLLITSVLGVDRIRGGVAQQVRFGYERSSPGVYTALVDSRGTMWIGEAAGLARLDRGDREASGAGLHWKSS